MVRRSPADWPLRVVPLSEDRADLSASTTPEQRLAMVWELTKEAWAWARLPLPAYDRSTIPVTTRSLR